MNPALSTIQNDVRAAELRDRAERERAHHAPRRARRANRELDGVQAVSPKPSYATLFFRHGFFGREHGSHA